MKKRLDARGWFERLEDRRMLSTATDGPEQFLPADTGSLSAEAAAADAPEFSVQSLQRMSISGYTEAKPQSKVWTYENTWWTALPNSSGTWIWRLDGTQWQAVLKLSSTRYKVDALQVDDLVHILMPNGASSKLATVEYVPGTPGSYAFWSQRPALAGVALSSSAETATIDIDSTGRLWIASDTDDSIEVRYSDPQSHYGLWSGPITLATNVANDDIAAVTAMPGGAIGVLWSNQIARRFGFRLHRDSDDPAVWSNDEIPASQSALDVGGGMADDHLHMAVSYDGTLYAAIKTSFATDGYTKIGLLVRRPDGSWDDLYTVDAVDGTRPIVVLSEPLNRLLVLYDRSGIVYRESPLVSIAFGGVHALMSGEDVTSTKRSFTDELVVIARGYGVLMHADVPEGQPPTISDLPDRSINEDTSSGPIAFTIGDTETPAELLHVSFATSNPVLVPEQNIVLAGVGADRSVTITPAANQFGTTTISILVRDANGHISGDSFRLTVDPANDPPTLSSLSTLTGAEEDQELAIAHAALAAASDAFDLDGDALAFRIESIGSGTLTKAGAPVVPGETLVAPGETLLWTPPAELHGLFEAFAAVVWDGQSASPSPVPVTVQLLSVNDPPSFVKGADQTVDEDAGPQTVDGWAAGMLSGPPDEANQTLTFLVTTDNNALFAELPAIDATTGTLTYTPAPNAFGSATVTVRLQDNGGTANGGVNISAPQTFTVTVNPVSDPPTLSRVNTLTGAKEDREFTISYSALAAASDAFDADGDMLVFRIESIGSGTSTVLTPGGWLLWPPPANANGLLTPFTVVVWDGQSASTPPVTVTVQVEAVNDPPSFVKGMDQTANEDAGPQAVEGWATAMLAGPANESGQSLTFLLATDNDALFAVLPAIDANGRLSYTPAADAFGSATVTVRLQDDGGSANGGVDTSAPQTFTISINPVNDPPSFSKGADLSVYEDGGPQSVDGWATAILPGPANETGQSLSFLVTTDNDALFAELPSIDATGRVRYTPAPDAFGAAIVTVRLQDDNGTARGGIDISASQTFKITVHSVNDPPSFTKGADQTVDEDAGPQAVDGWATAILAGPANETGQALTFLLTTDNDALFAAVPSIDATGNLRYTPAANTFGTATIAVRLQDGGGMTRGGVDISAAQTFTIAINPINDPPTLTNVNALSGTEEDRPFAISYAALAAASNASDADGDTLAFRIESLAGGMLTKSGTAVVPGAAILASGESLLWTPPADASGLLEAFAIGAWDGQLASSAAVPVAVQVQAINDAPSFVKGGDQTVDEDAGPQAVAGWATAISSGPADETGQAISFLITTDNDALFAVLPSIDATGRLSYTPAADVFGSAMVTVRLQDDGGTANGGVDTSASQTFTITVNPVNDPPSFSKGADQAVNEDAGLQAVHGWATAIAAGPANEASQAITFLVTTDNGALFAVLPSIDAAGGLSYTPAADASGSATVTVRLQDGGGTARGGIDTSAFQTFTITVNPVNDAPWFLKGTDQAIDEDSGPQAVAGWATAISSGPADEAGQSLTFQVTTDNDALFAVLPSVDTGGRLSYTPADNAFGSATVIVRLADDGGTANGGIETSAPQTFTITVNPVNDAPTLGSVSILGGASENDPFTIGYAAMALAADEADVDGDILAFRIESVSNGTLTKGGVEIVPGATVLATGQSLVWLPPESANGLLEAFAIRVWDGQAASAAAVPVNVEVLEINHAPSFTKGADQVIAEDSPTVTISGWATNISPGPADEAEQTLTFQVTTDNDALFALQPRIDPATGDLSYTPAGNAFGSATVTVRLHDDGGTADGGADISAPQTFTITVHPVNDPPSFSKGPDQAVNEDTGPQDVDGWATAILAGPANEADQGLTFLITTDNDALFAALPSIGGTGRLSYAPAADAFGSATVTVRLQDGDGTAGGGIDVSAAQTFTITVAPINDPPSFRKGADQTIHEDAGLQEIDGWATAILAGPANEAGQTLTFLITTDNDALFAVLPSIDETGRLSYMPVAGTYGSAMVTLRLHDDGGTAGGGMDTSAPQAFTITVNSLNDPPSFHKGTDLAADEDAGPQEVNGWATAILAGPADEAGQTLTFLVTTDNDAMFAALPSIDAAGRLSYTPAADAFGSAIVTVRLQDDGGTAGGGVNTSAPQTLTITVNPINDPPSFRKGADQTVNEDAGPQAVNGWATAILAGPAGETGQTLMFLVATDNDALFAVLPSIDATGNLSYTPAAGAFGSATVTVRLQDDGGTAGGGADTSAPQPFTITVNPVNDPPSFYKGADQTVQEDAGPQSVDGWATAIIAGPPDEADQTLTFLVTTDNPALFAVPPTIDETGKLDYTPASDAFGSATLTVRLQDDGGTADGGMNTSALQTFTITVNPVNDPPLFRKGADLAIDEDAGPQAVSGWATALSPGPANEAGQAVALLVTIDNGAMFAALPSIDVTGRLTYTPAANAFGSATVTVWLQDSGGTAGGGMDTSGPHRFTITVHPVNDPPVAVPNGPYQVEFGSHLRLDGTGSYDVDFAAGDSIESYRWDLGDDGTWDYEGDQVTVPWEVLAALPREIATAVRLEVSDSLGLTAGATTTVVVQSADRLESVDFLLLESQDLSQGSRWYQLSPRYDGVLTVESLRGDVQIELLDETLVPLPTTSSLDGQPRVDRTVSAGEALYVRLSGTAESTDLRIANLVHRGAEALTVHGTAGSDQVAFDIGSSTMTIKGVAYDFRGSASLTFDGGGGGDHVQFVGSNQDDFAELRPHSATLQGNGYRIVAPLVASSNFDGGDGQDIVRLYGTGRADTLTLGSDALGAESNVATLAGSDLSISAKAEVIHVYGRGGADKANLYGSLSGSAEQFQSSWKWARIRGDGYRREARGFRDVFDLAAQAPSIASSSELSPAVAESSGPDGSDTNTVTLNRVVPGEPQVLQVGGFSSPSREAALIDAVMDRQVYASADGIAWDDSDQLLWLDQLARTYRQQERSNDTATTSIRGLDWVLSYWE